MSVHISWPRVGLEVAALAAATVFWFLVHAILTSDAGWVTYSLAFLAFVVWLAGLSFAALFLQRTASFFVLVILSELSALSFFGISAFKGMAGWVMFAALVLFLLNAWLGRRWMRDDVENRLKLRLNRTLHLGLPYFITPVALLLAALFLAYPPASFSSQLGQVSIPRPVFDGVVGPLVQVVGGQSAVLGGSQVSRYINMDQLYILTNDSIANFLRPHKAELLIVAAVGIFFTLRAAGSFLQPVFIGLILIFFRILYKLRFLKKVTRKREQNLYRIM